MLAKSNYYSAINNDRIAPAISSVSKMPALENNVDGRENTSLWVNDPPNYLRGLCLLADLSFVSMVSGRFIECKSSPHWAPLGSGANKAESKRRLQSRSVGGSINNSPISWNPGMLLCSAATFLLGFGALSNFNFLDDDTGIWYLGLTSSELRTQSMTSWYSIFPFYSTLKICLDITELSTYGNETIWIK